MGMKIVAVPADLPGLHGQNLGGETSHINSNAPPKYQPITGFTSLADLIAQINAALDADNFNCLEELEIVAHGNPGICDGITQANAATFGAQLKGVRLCDEVNLYFSGCNTAINRRNQFCIAQLVSAAGPTEKDDMVHLFVYGAVGYLSGYHMDGSEKTTGDRIQAGVHGAGYPYGYPDAPDASGTPDVSVGSHNAVGDSCWRGYREGRRIK